MSDNTCEYLNSATPTLLSANVDEQPTPPAAFSEVQITQLRSLILVAVHSERVGSPQLPVPVVKSAALSPATPQPPQPSRAIPTSTFSSTNNAMAVQDGAGLTPTPGPSLPPTLLLERLVLLHLPIPCHLSHKKYCNALPNVSTLILLIFCLIIYISPISGHPESIQIRGQPSRSLPNVSTLILLIFCLIIYISPISGHPESIQIRGQPSRSLSIGHSSLASMQTAGGWSSLLAGGLECLSSNSPPLLPSPRP